MHAWCCVQRQQDSPSPAKVLLVCVDLQAQVPKATIAAVHPLPDFRSRQRVPCGSMTSTSVFPQYTVVRCLFWLNACSRCFMRCRFSALVLNRCWQDHLHEAAEAQALCVTQMLPADVD